MDSATLPSSNRYPRLRPQAARSRVRRAAGTVLILLIGLYVAPACLAGGDDSNSGRSAKGSANPVVSALFKRAFQSAQAGELDPDGTLARMLQNYPLAPYLTAARLEYQLGHRPTPTLDQRIHQFIHQHPTLPPAQQLRWPWLMSLIDRERWQPLLAATKNTPESTTLRCGVVHARIENGQTPAQAALDLWYAGQSQPSACNPVFAWLNRTGRLTPDVIQKRAKLALIAGHAGLARYLHDKLDSGSGTAQQIARWEDLATHPTRLEQAGQLPQRLAVAIFKRFALIDLDTAAASLPLILDNLEPSGAARYQMRRWVTLLYAEEHQTKALRWFARLNPERMADDEQVLGWWIRAAIYHQRWQLALKRLNVLPAGLADNNNWRYWRARTLAQLGQPDKAKAIYHELSDKRAYYGFLAADRIGQSYQLNSDPLAGNPSIQRHLTGKPGIIRAHLLYQMGFAHRATREWRTALAEANEQTQAQAAILAYHWGWYPRAIVTLARSDYWDDLRIRYPTPYMQIVHYAAKANGLPAALVLAVMRTESLFQADIRSAAGAIGLMQLLPDTARHVANQLSDQKMPAEPLTAPAINIPLGSRYLAHLLNRWNGNPALTLASYNAGASKVEEWLPGRTHPADIWIANIPYSQTRHYVQRALKHLVVFDTLLDRKTTQLDARLAPIAPDYAGN